MYPKFSQSPTLRGYLNINSKYKHVGVHNIFWKFSIINYPTQQNLAHGFPEIISQLFHKV